MWKSREGQAPPANFYAAVYGFLSQAYPGAEITKGTMESLKPAWDKLWRDGRNAEVVAKSTCSCDGRNITISPAFGVELPKGAYRAPLGQPRGELFNATQLRESVPVERAKAQHARLDSQVGRLTNRTEKLEGRAGRAAEGERRANLLSLLEAERAELQVKQDQAQEMGENIEAMRRQLKVLAPPKGAPEPAPRKERQTAAERQVPPKQAAQPTQARPKPKAAEKPAPNSAAKSAPKPAAKPAANSAAKPATKPAPKPAAKPAASSVAKPVAKSASEAAPAMTVADQAILNAITASLPALAEKLASNLTKKGT